MTNQELVIQFLNGFDQPEQLQNSLELLANDYSFQNPMIKLHSKEEFTLLAQELTKSLTGVELINAVQNGDWVATHYTFKSAIPGLESNRASEWFRVAHGKIQESILIYDASKWREVYEKLEN